MRQVLRSAAIFGVLLMIALPASSQTFPDRIIKIVVAAPPGGGLDVLARALAQELTARWGKSVVVDNRPGASGLIGAEAVANAPPDGYTWLAVTDQIYLSNRFSFKALPYNPDAFANISLVAQADQFVLASPKVPARDIRELIALDRQKPGALAYGSWGDGSAPQLLFETMNKIAGTSLLGVPYTPDDVEMLELCQRGFANSISASWNDLSRGMLSNAPKKNDELQMRTFWRRWRQLVSGDHTIELTGP